MKAVLRPIAAGLALLFVIATGIAAWEGCFLLLAAIARALHQSTGL